jgi:hypothetical protein
MSRYPCLGLSTKLSKVTIQVLIWAASSQDLLALPVQLRLFTSDLTIPKGRGPGRIYTNPNLQSNGRAHTHSGRQHSDKYVPDLIVLACKAFQNASERSIRCRAKLRTIREHPMFKNMSTRAFALSRRAPMHLSSRLRWKDMMDEACSWRPITLLTPIFMTLSSTARAGDPDAFNDFQRLTGVLNNDLLLRSSIRLCEASTEQKA